MLVSRPAELLTIPFVRAINLPFHSLSATIIYYLFFASPLTVCYQFSTISAKTHTYSSCPVNLCVSRRELSRLSAKHASRLEQDTCHSMQDDAGVPESRSGSGFSKSAVGERNECRRLRGGENN